jgi:hypothetical protein
MTIQRNEARLITLHQLCCETSVAIQKLTPYEKALLRIRLRKYYGLPEVREPKLEN